MKQRKRDAARPPTRKQRYATPRLAAYGDLRRLTKVKDGNMNDGAGKPMTKAGGTNS